MVQVFTPTSLLFLSILVCTSLTNPYCFFVIAKSFCVNIYLDVILVLTHSKHVGKSVYTFLCSLLLCLGLHTHFTKSELCFLGLCWDIVDMFVPLPSDKHIYTQQLAHALLLRPTIGVYQVISFFGQN